MPSRSKGPATVWCVDVVVPLPIDRPFTYRLPDWLKAESVAPGHRVLVPWGSSLRFGVTWTAAYAESAATDDLRELIDYESEFRILSPGSRQLLDWMGAYYQAPLGESLRLVAPSGVLKPQPAVFELTETGRSWLKRHPDHSDTAVLRCVMAPKHLEAWSHEAKQSIPVSSIRKWERDGLLNVRHARHETRPSTPMLDVVALTASGGRATAGDFSRAPKKWAVLNWLQTQPHRLVPLTAINRQLTRGSQFVRQLATAGFCRIDRIPVHEFEVVQNAPEDLTRVDLTSEQDVAVKALDQALDRGGYRTFLLHGVTGSGKTEIYLRAIEKCLAMGRQALFLVPEIGLTPVMRYQITQRFGDALAILHSAFGHTRRSIEWAKIAAGKVDLVLGARSAVFAPLSRLGLIVVDEEHDTSYKQNDAIRYHARNVALMRGKMEDAVVVLGSATPSLESWHNHLRGRFELVQLTQRATQAPLPRVDVVDMRQELQRQRRRVVFSQLLIERMETTLNAGEQVMILLNRRGFHQFLLCRRCGQAVMCPHCEVTLTYHTRPHGLKCHYCNHVQSVPGECPACGEAGKLLHFFGEGTQQIEELLAERFPGVAVDRLDRDRVRKRGQVERILNRFRTGETRILVGTQMIAKGHDFHKVTLVGILNADMSLRSGDFRSAEHTYQLVTQVAGRSGRGERPGTVVIQTYLPEHYSITCAAAHDFSGFLKRELRFRKQLSYPPFSHMVQIIIRHKDAERAHRAGSHLAAFFKGFAGNGRLVVLGPTRAPVARIKGDHRFQILLKSPHRAWTHDLVRRAMSDLAAQKIIPARAIAVDIDPFQFN